VRMDATLFFANCEHFKDVIMQAVEGHYHTSPLRIEKIVIDAKCWIDIDLAGISKLFEIKQELIRLPSRPILVLANAHDEIVHVLGSSFADDRCHIVLSINDAVAMEVSCSLSSIEEKAVDHTDSKDIDSNVNVEGVGKLLMLTSTHLCTKLSPTALVHSNQDSKGMLNIVHNALKVTAPGSSSSSRNSYVKLAIHDDSSSSSSSSML
jgi:MFS superfamily sulfate permease-like transporter